MSDAAVIYSWAPSVVQTIEFLRSAFSVFQSHLTPITLILNAGEKKIQIHAVLKGQKGTIE